jgi:hypothetical protein
MERRSSNRVIVRLSAEIISSTTSYPSFIEITTEYPGVSFYNYAGIIENLSEDGLMITVPAKSKLNLSPGSKLEVGFQLPSGERLNLNCMVRRFQGDPAHEGLEHTIGILIIDPPPVYSSFFTSERN